MRTNKERRTPWVSALVGLIAGFGVGILFRPNYQPVYAYEEFVPALPKSERFYVIEGGGDKFNPATDVRCNAPVRASTELTKRAYRYSALPASPMVLPADRLAAEQVLQSACGPQLRIVDSGTWNSRLSSKNGLVQTNEPGDDARKYLVQLSQNTHIAPSASYFSLKSASNAVLILNTDATVFSVGDQISTVYSTPGGPKLANAKGGTYYVGGLGNKSLIVSVEF
ncbi:hypothetical protein QPK87_37320 [Kamptonema cortianum]|nr:hypothetical protein [Geitlerinema splendidum]MDK3162169.1 hypothetical protein [Kamptonema cortianum]